MRGGFFAGRAPGKDWPTQERIKRAERGEQSESRTPAAHSPPRVGVVGGWRRELDHNSSWQVPEAERSRLRRLIMVEIHLAALIPLVAVIMSRGLLR